LSNSCTSARIPSVVGGVPKTDRKETRVYGRDSKPACKARASLSRRWAEGLRKASIMLSPERKLHLKHQSLARRAHGPGSRYAFRKMTLPPMRIHDKLHHAASVFPCFPRVRAAHRLGHWNIMHSYAMPVQDDLQCVALAEQVRQAFP